MARQSDPPVGLAMVGTRLAPYDLAALAGYHAPWYREGSGTGEVRYDRRGAVPLRHAELATDLSSLRQERRSRIGELRDHYATRLDAQGISLMLATYALGPDGYLVLDGNHRLTALAQLVAKGCPATLTEFRLTAPLDPALLPDLRHYRGGGRGAAPGA
ncbi:hypothetical protein FNH09_23690 [Streptomyces adustus]|uniref:ParB/Sulfiredoxin domain-containing protein n=1 Tax=Streptomyces adustus TaxID=1609272 RepID=A0A5N8VHH9_9ACTN|nr:hypothetical protein [Streptomyces adustus]MPY34142.1 hypothetical protein [Streptomyces adustus]